MAKASAGSWGGAANSGGVNFQAVITGIVAVRMLGETPLGWLEGIVDDVPKGIFTETGGPGDDLRVELKSGELLEVQIKKGLARGRLLWESLENLALGIHGKMISYGVLVVAPDSSSTVRNELSRDIERLGQGRTDDLTKIGSDFQDRLKKLGVEVAQVCGRLRVRVVNGLNADLDHVMVAKDLLRAICLVEEKAEDAWNRLYRDCVSLMECRGRRDRCSLLQLLAASGVELRGQGSAKPHDNSHPSSDHPKVLATRLLLAIERGVNPGTNSSIQPNASVREADQILQEYRSLAAVALLEGKTRAISNEFVRDAYNAIEMVRLLSRTSEECRTGWFEARSAWRTLIDTEERLREALTSIYTSPIVGF